jgi:hypothetical protein
MTSAAEFDIYFPDQFIFTQSNADCFIALGTNYKIGCTFQSQASGYGYKATLTNVCPFTCLKLQTYIIKIGVTTRGDNYPMGGNFTFVVKYPWIDVGYGNYTNAISFTADTMTSHSAYNDGCNTIEAVCSIYVSVKIVNPFNSDTNRGRIRIVLPTTIYPYTNVC